MCTDPLGMANGDIPDANIQASTESEALAKDGRLNAVGCWRASIDDTTPWIHANIGNDIMQFIYLTSLFFPFFPSLFISLAFLFSLYNLI